MSGSHDSGEVPAQSDPRAPPRRRPRSKPPEPPKKLTVKVPVQWSHPDRPPTFAGIDSDPTPTGPRSSPPPRPALRALPTPLHAHLPVVPPPNINDEDTLDEPPPPTLYPVTTASKKNPALTRQNTSGEYRYISSKPPKREPPKK